MLIESTCVYTPSDLMRLVEKDLKERNIYGYTIEFDHEKSQVLAKGAMVASKV